MSRSSSLHGITSTIGNNNSNNKKFKGVRRRKWGKWVSEIRVPGTQERLWLGTYATPEAAAVAHDVSVYCLRRPSSLEKLNFPETLSSYCCVQQLQRDLSPRSVQEIASEAGMAVDAQNIIIAGTGKKTSSSSSSSLTSTVTLTLTEEPSYDQEEKSTDDGVNIQPNRNDHSDLIWWESLGDDCTGTWQASSEASREGEALSISVEDYL